MLIKPWEGILAPELVYYVLEKELLNFSEITPSHTKAVLWPGTY